MPEVEYQSKYTEFEKKLRRLINEESMENHSNTDDATLARYLMECLRAYERAVGSRDFMGRKDENTGESSYSGYFK